MLKHAKVSAKADGVDPTLVQPTDWNADHVFTGDVTLPANLLLPNGNIGVGRTPEAWVGYRVVAVGLGATIAGDMATGLMHQASNLWYDGVNWKLIAAGTGGVHASGGGEFAWSSAPTPGVAGAVATLTERMRLNGAGNLGIGRTAENWDAGNKGIAFGAAGSIYAANAPGSAIMSWAVNTYFDGASHRYINANAAALFLSGNGDHVWYGAPVGAAGGVATYTEKMRLNGNGSLGIGCVPSPWAPSIKVLQLSSGGSIACVNATGALNYFVNGYFDGASYRYINASGISLFAQGNDTFVWYLAAAGAAGAVASLSPMMTMVSPGVLSLVATGCTLKFDAFGVQTTLDLNGSIITPNNGNGITMRCITGGVILSNSATSWASASAVEYKRDIVPLPAGAVARIAQLPKILFRYNDDADERDLRCGTTYEGALSAMPYITTYRPHSVMRDEKSGDTREVEEFKGVSLELCIPDLLLAIDELNARITAGGL